MNGSFYLKEKLCFILKIFRFFVLGESKNFKVYGVIISSIVQWKLHFLLCLQNPRQCQDEIWLAISETYGRHFKLLLFPMKDQKLVQGFFMTLIKGKIIQSVNSQQMIFATFDCLIAHLQKREKPQSIRIVLLIALVW